MKSFLQQLESFSRDIPEDSSADTGKIYAAVFNRTDGLEVLDKRQSQRKTHAATRKMFRPRVVVASLLAATVFAGTAAAYYYRQSVNDAFNGVLKQNSPNGAVVDISSDSPIAGVVDKSGMVVDSPVVVDGVEVNVRGVVGAGNELKILVDIEDLSGNPLALFNGDGTISQNPIGFGSVVLRTEETKGMDNPFKVRSSFHSGNADIMIAPIVSPEIERQTGFIPFPQHTYRSDITESKSPSKASVLISISLDGNTIDDLMDGSLYLTIENVVQAILSHGTDTDANVYDLVSRFDSITDADLLASGGSTKDFVNWNTSYTLITDSGNEVSLTDSGEYSDHVVTNAGVKDGILYIRGKCPAIDKGADENVQVSINGYAEQTMVALRNTKTGEFFKSEGGGGSYEQGQCGKCENCSEKCDTDIWAVSIEGVNSLEELRDYTLVFGYGTKSEVLAEGAWEFEFPITFENLAQTREIGKSFTLGGFELTANTLTVSPYYLSLNVTADMETLKKLTEIRDPHSVPWSPMVTGLSYWDRFLGEEQPSATVIMKDGSEIEARIFGSFNSEDGNSDFSLTPDVVIDPEQIESIRIGDLIF